MCPGRNAPPQEPGQRQGNRDSEGGGGDRQQQRGNQRTAPARVGENLRVPGEREADRRKREILLLVDRDAEHDDQRRREEQRDQEEIEAAEPGHPAFSRRPTSSVIPTSDSDINTRNTAIAAAKGM